MKAIKIITVLILMLAGTGFTDLTKAQNDNDAIIGKIHAQRVAFYTERMNLTPAEAEKFWPVYNEYDDKRSKIVAEETRLTRSFRKNQATMSESDIDATIKKIIQLRKAQVAILEDYNPKFREVLPAKKVMKLYLVEVEFRKYLMNQLRQVRNNNRPNNKFNFEDEGE